MADLPISGLPVITVVSSDYLLAAVSESVTAQMTVKQVGDAYSSSLSTFPYTGSARITGSLNVTGSGTLNGCNILTSCDTGSFITSNQTGSFYSSGNFGYYGAFCSTASQTNPVANISRSMVLETTEHTNGVTIVGGSRITVTNAGTYNLQFSAQLQKTDNGVDSAYIWFKKNGSNVPRSNTNVEIAKNAGGNGTAVAAWNYIDTYNAGDYIEITWQSSDITMQLLAASASGNYPAIPSVIATLNQI